MSEHTKGPWSWWTSCSFRRLSGADGRDGGVLYATTQLDGHPDVVLPNGGVDGPDARLIAAAPDLLEALVAMRTMMDAGPQPKKLNEALTWRQCDEKARAMCDAAIAKARGRP